MAQGAHRRQASSRRSFLARTAALSAGALLAPAARLLAAQDDSWILLLVCDSLRADRLGCYGYRRSIDGQETSTTPVIDSLAESGVLYENCLAQASWTRTSMASMLYSVWPALKGDTHTFGYVPVDSRALESAAGALTRIGVTANPYLTDRYFSDRFDSYRFCPHKEYMPARQMNHEFDWDLGPVARKKRPVFGYVHYMDPHEPYNYRHDFRGLFAPRDWSYSHPLWINDQMAPYRDDTGLVTSPDLPDGIALKLSGTGDAYDEDVMYLDQHIGVLFDVLKRYQMLDRTTVIIASDHGQAFGEHGWCGHKVTLYQEEIHVPLIICGPGVPKGVRVKAQVRNVDILPTIAALTGVSPQGLAGAPLLPAERVEAAGNRLAYSCCDYARYGPVQRLITCLVTPERMKYVRVLTQERRLLREELYDLAADPGEKNDLAASSADLLAALSRRMDGLEQSAHWDHATGRTAPDQAVQDQLRALGYH